MPDPVVPLDADRLARIVGIADADRRDRGLPPWRNEYGEDVLALVAAARKLDLMLSHESIYAECDALRAERDRLVVGKRKYRRERDALRAEVERLRERQVPDGWEVEWVTTLYGVKVKPRPARLRRSTR